MLLIWVGLFIELFVLAILKTTIFDFEGLSIIVVLIHSLFTMIIFMVNTKRSKLILIGAYFSRLTFLFWDLYARNIFVFPSSGADSEMFYSEAIRVSNNLSLLNEPIMGELYAKINGIIFYLIGPQRLIGQYINVLLGVSVVYIIFKSLNILEIRDSVTKRILIIAAFFPNSLIMSSVFLREMFPTFFVSLSIYYFIKWFKLSKITDILISFVLLGFASIFHSGVIGIIVGFSYALLFFNKKSNTFKFSVKTIFSFILLLLIFSMGLSGYGDRILSKFGNLSNIEQLYSASNYREGGSVYLTGLVIDNPLKLVIFGPIKAVYFAISPMPMNWRGLADMITFFTDSILYLTIIIYFLKNRKKFGVHWPLVFSLFLMIIATIFIFGIGVSNAGTAMRHRQKLVPLFLILLGVMIEGRKTFNKRVSTG